MLENGMKVDVIINRIGRNRAKGDGGNSKKKPQVHFSSFHRSLQGLAGSRSLSDKGSPNDHQASIVPHTSHLSPIPPPSFPTSPQNTSPLPNPPQATKHNIPLPQNNSILIRLRSNNMHETPRFQNLAQCNLLQLWKRTHCPPPALEHEAEAVGRYRAEKSAEETTVVELLQQDVQSECGAG